MYVLFKFLLCAIISVYAFFEKYGFYGGVTEDDARSK